MPPNGRARLVALALWAAAAPVAAEFVLEDSKVRDEVWWPAGVKFQDKECVLWVAAAQAGKTFPLECSTAGSGLVEYDADVSAGAMEQRFGYPNAVSYLETGGSDYLLFALWNYGGQHSSTGKNGGYVYRRTGAETSFTLFQEINTKKMEGGALWTLPGSDQPMLGLAQPDLSTGNYHAGRGALEIYALQDGSFQLVQTIDGAFSKVHAFNINGRGYLAAGVLHSNNPRLFETDSFIYEWSDSAYSLVQAIPTKLCREFLPFEIDATTVGATTYLVSVNQRDDNGNHDQHAIVYQWETTGGGAFNEIQRFPTNSGHAAAVVSIGALTFLAIGSYGDGWQAQVYLWNGASFDFYQELDGLYAAKVYKMTGFTIDGQAYFGLGSGEGASMWKIDEASIPATTTETTSGTTTTSASATSGTTATATATTATATTTGTTDTATGTTLTTTGTATETWPLVAQCTMSTLTCPIPRPVARMAHVRYAVLGNESATTGQVCGPPPAAPEPIMFTVDVHACNVTATPDQQELAVTLVPVIEQGQLLFGGSEPPIILCKCVFGNSTATVGLSVAVDLEDGPTQNVEGGSAFSPALRLFSDPDFTQSISPGQDYPVTSELFYVEIATNQTEDVIGAPTCTVAPTNDTDHEFAQPVFDGYCSTPVFGVAYSSNPGDGGPSHTLRWSMRKFKFAGYPAVHIVCEVTRCDAAPCGTCSSTQQPRRRLHRNLQQDQNGVATSYFSLPPGGPYLVLPGDVPEDAKRVKFVSPSRPQTALNITWVNVTIYSFPGIEDGGQFAGHFEELLRGYVGSEVHVQQVWQVGDSAIADATIVSVYQVQDGATEGFDSRMQQLPQSSFFLPTLLQMLGEHDHKTELMRAEVSFSTAVPGSRDFLATAPAPDPSSDSAQLPGILGAVAALVAVTAVVVACILCMMRSRRKRAQQQAEGQAAKAAEGGPGKVGQAATGADADREAGELAEAAEGGFIGADRAAVAANADQEAGERAAAEATERDPDGMFAI